MKKEIVNMGKTIIEPVIQRLTPQLSERQITINCENDLPEVYLDPARISQVLQNLIQNAIKFTRKSGNINVGLSKAADRQIELRVSDTGSGIPKESLNSIFEVFYTTGNDGNTERSKMGRGLGLSICKEIVKAHDGAIWAESEGAGKGSTFIVMLPVDGSESAS